MTFHVPEKHAGLFDEVERRFRLLLSRNVVTGITEPQFDKWLSNLVTDEEQYLGARLLENLTFRSEHMVGSAIGHILECILPSELRRSGADVRSVDEFVASLQAPGSGRPLRFVEVDDPKGRTPGKSGGLVIRELQRLGRVDKSLTCLPENIGSLPKTVNFLVFIDDMLGTGTQFKAFCDKYQLAQEASHRTLIYCPLATSLAAALMLATRCSAWRLASSSALRTAACPTRPPQSHGCLRPAGALAESQFCATTLEIGRSLAMSRQSVM